MRYGAFSLVAHVWFPCAAFGRCCLVPWHFGGNLDFVEGAVYFTTAAPFEVPLEGAPEPWLHGSCTHRRHLRRRNKHLRASVCGSGTSWVYMAYAVFTLQRYRRAGFPSESLRPRTKSRLFPLPVSKGKCWPRNSGTLSGRGIVEQCGASSEFAEVVLNSEREICHSARSRRTVLGVRATARRSPQQSLSLASPFGTFFTWQGYDFVLVVYPHTPLFLSHVRVAQLVVSSLAWEPSQRHAQCQAVLELSPCGPCSGTSGENRPSPHATSTLLRVSVFGSYPPGMLSDYQIPESSPAGATACATCLPGMFNDHEMPEGATCQPGLFVDVSGITACLQRLIGTHTSTELQTTCTYPLTGLFKGYEVVECACCHASLVPTRRPSQSIPLALSHVRLSSWMTREIHQGLRRTL